MKINPIGIQSYEQVTQQQRQPNAAETKDTAVQPKVSIPVQETEGRSQVSVKLPGDTYGKFLSTEEKQALELLFSRFREASRFGAGYTRDMETSDETQVLGNVVDLKA